MEYVRHQGINEVEIKYKDKQGNEKKKKVKDLYNRIEEMFNKGIITEQQKATLHELRFLGNSALHEMDIPEKDDVSLGIDIIENMLQNLYEILLKERCYQIKEK